MIHHPVRALDVAGPLERELLVGACPGPDRDGKLHRLEVQVGSREGLRVEERDQLRVDLGLTPDGDRPDAFVARVCKPSFRNVANIQDPLGDQLGRDPAAVGQERHRIVRLRRGAVAEEGAPEGIVAVRAHLPRRARAGQGGAALGHPVGDLGQACADLIADVLDGEQALVVPTPGVDEAVVDMGELHLP